MTTPQKLAEFLGANKTLGYQLWIATQANTESEQIKSNIEKLTQRIEASYEEIFGVTPNWK